MDNNIEFKDLNIFGIRHLSPSGAYHLEKYLDEKKPKCVLIEGPIDATPYLHYFSNKKVKLPIAILAYTLEFPIHTILFPFAEYSPEYVAIVWALKHKVEVRFIDLNSENSLLLHKEKYIDENTDKNIDYYKLNENIYTNLANLNGEEDYETYWERNFEHNLNKDSYLNTVEVQSTFIREMTISLEEETIPTSYAYNYIRESFMKRQIQNAIEEGYKPEKIVIVCGAYHISGLKSDLKPMTQKEIEKLPSVKTKITLMPYSYYKLSSMSGYGAGNMAPAYYSIMYKSMKEEDLESFPVKYLSSIGKFMRSAGNIASTANVIESLRLANAIASIHDGFLPTLKDLHDAVVACMGHGNLSEVAESFARLDIGTDIGQLPDMIEKTPIQEDMTRELKRLKLEQYNTNILKELDLDLRENRRVKTQAAAFIDLERSFFLNRLEVLNITFAKKIRINQDGASWAEKWHLMWTPEVEIEIIESNLKGETIEIAASYEIKESLLKVKNIFEASKLIKKAYECKLTNVLEDALIILQQMAIDSGNFVEVAHATFELSVIIKYQDIRKIDANPLVPILQQLFLRGSLLLIDASSCDNTAAKEQAAAINIMHLISDENYEIVDNKIWIDSLKELANRDDKNPLLSGLAFSILLEKNIVSDEKCASEVSLRLSPALPADIGAGWFEGLSMRNRYALLSRISIWKELDKYVQSLSEDEFYRAVVFLRRAFGSFEVSEKNGITELLGDFWGFNILDTQETLLEDLLEDEENILSDLNDFDFGDLI